MTTFSLRRPFVAALALTFIAPVAWAQQARAAIDPTTVPELRAEFDRAAALGVPTAALIAKAQEGFVSAASTNRIRVAVRGLTDRLVAARAALQPVMSDAELEAGANALQAGVSDRVLRNLRALDKTRSLTMAIGVLQELVTRGVPPKQAVASVEAMLRRNMSDVVIASVGRNVQGDVASGLAPSVAMDVRSRGVLSLPQAAAPGSAVAPTTTRPPPR